MVIATRSPGRNPLGGASHPVGWFAPQPLWTTLPRNELLARRGQPVLLRFATDTFMEDLIAEVGANRELGPFVAQPETWKRPDAGLDAQGRDKPGHLKLYQSSHSRFYLVAGALACKIPGVPDRQVDTAASESVFFVMRRQRIENGQIVEYGWSTGQQTTQPPLRLARRMPSTMEAAGNRGWKPLAKADSTVLVNEERLPLFPLRFEDSDGITRTMMAGMVPVASGDTYLAPSALSPLPADGTFAGAGGDPRPALFQQQVVDTLEGLKTWYSELPADTKNDRTSPEMLRAMRTTAYLLLDLMTTLRDHLPDLLETLLARRQTARISARSGLEHLIASTTDGTRPLVDVLRAIERDRSIVESLEAEDELLETWEFDWFSPTGLSHLNTWLDPKTGVQAAFEAAIAEAKVSAPSVPSQHPETPKYDDTANPLADWLVLRMVYDRPNCGETSVSQPSRRFTLAPFFDPDAPARKIRIPLPVDTSPEGLRKFDKGVAVLLSKQLRAQMDRVSGLKDLEEGKLNDEQPMDLGMICSLSIPIITICAMLLLMIIVQILNIVFWWLPFFKICLPIRR